MNIETLKSIYVNSEITNEPLSNEDYLVVFDGFKYLNIPHKDLNEREALLIKALYNNKSSKSIWYQYFMNPKQHLDVEYESIQCIQFNVEKNHKIAAEWLQSFSSFFDNVIDVFYISDHYGVLLIERLKKTEEELLGIIDTLDVDYSTNTSLYIGVVSNSKYIRDLFHEERKLFDEMRHLARISKFSDSFINSFIVESVEKSEISRSLRTLLHAQPELPQLIISLWKNQGNQSAVAKEIFVHRNTINYRIDKLSEEFNINLRDMNQLFICYVLVK